MGYGTTRARRSVRVTRTIMLGMLALGSLATSDGHDATPVGDTPREMAPFRAVQSTSETSFRIDRSGTGVLRVDEGSGLDSYVFRSGSPLSIRLETAPYGEDQGEDVPTWGPVDGDGHPLPGHAFHGDFGRLTLRVFDVDDDYAGGQFAPEVDEVSVNGTVLPGALSGADNQWSINTFDVPLELVRFPTTDDPTGTNTIEIDIDTTNSGADVWAVEADWAELRLDADPVPLGLAHGLGDTAATLDHMEEWFEDNVDGLGATDVQSLGHSSVGLINENARTIGTELADLRSRTGASTANIVGHSKGGLDSRRYAFDHPGRVESLVMLGTPNGGSELAQDYCDSAMGGGIGFRAWVARQLGVAATDCTSEDDATYQTTQTYVRDVFNAVVRDSPRVDYFTVAGQNSLTWTAGWLNGEDDGAVEVASVRWLRFDRPTDPGRHDYWRDGLPENHFELAGYTAYQENDHTSVAWPIAACRLYGLRTEATCEPNRVAATATNSFSATAAEPTSEVAEATDLQVPAGASSSLTLELESAGAHVAILGPGIEDATVTLDGATFTPTRILGIPAMGGSTEGQGSTELVVTNPADEPLDLAVLAWVETTRTVSVNTPALAEPGEPVTVVATVSEPDPSDALTLTFDGSQLPMTSDATGRWTAQVTPSAPGHWHAVVHSGGERTRMGSATVSVATGQASLQGSFVESVERSTYGRITELTVAPRVVSDVAGRWRVTLTLNGTDGRTVTSATGVAELPAGGGVVPVSVTGAELHAGGLDGPWTIADVLLVEEETDHFSDHANELGQTAAYQLGELDRDMVLVDDSFTDRGIDSDGDGDFDQLEVAGQVTVERATTYAVNGRLIAADGTEVGEAATFASLGAGTNHVTWTFDGAAIGASGHDGPYRLVDVSVYAPSDGDAFDYLVEAHVTAPYHSYEFEGGAVTLERLRQALETERATGRVSDGVARSLDAKLVSAMAAFERGNDGAACNRLSAFANQLEAQRGQHVDTAAYDRLRPLLDRLRAQRC